MWKNLQIKTWINCFITNCSATSKDRIKGPVTTIEINAQKRPLVQNHAGSFEASESRKQTFNLQRNSAGLYQCRGRVHGHYSKLIIKDSTLAEKIVEDAHIRTLHGGLNLTMTEV